MPSSSPWKIRVLDTTAAFDEAKDAWKQLERETAHSNVSASYDWLRTWWEVFEKREDNQFGYDKQLRILTAWRGDALEAIVPLVRLCRKKWFVKVSYIEFLGQQWGATLLDFIGGQAGMLEAVRTWLRANERYDILRLAYIPEDTKAFPIQGGPMWLFSGCPIIRAEKYVDHEAYMKATYSKGFRKHIRQMDRNVAEAGVAPEYAAEQASVSNLQEVVRISSGKLADGKRSLYRDSDKLRFMEKMFERFRCDVEFLRIGDRAVAYRLGVEFGGGIFAFDTSYDREFRELAVGHLLYRETIRRFFADRRLAFHCAGVGVDPHKLSHYGEVVRLYSYVEPGHSLGAGLVARRERGFMQKVQARVLSSLAGHAR